MTNLQKLALIPPLLLGLVMGMLALFAPDRLADALGGFEATGPVGQATLRADLAAFFLTGALGGAMALFKGRRDWLWAPLSLFGMAVVGRLIDGVLSGFASGAFQPIMVELVMCGLILFAMRGSKST